jgi:hypothetical protein
VIVVLVDVLVDDLRPRGIESEKAKNEVGRVFVKQVIEG